MLHEVFAALAAGLHAFGLTPMQILMILVLLVLVMALCRKRIALWLKPIKTFAELNTPKSALRRLILARHGPDWEVVADRVRTSAEFVQSSDTNDGGFIYKPLFHVHGDPRSLYEMKKPSERRIHIFFCQGIRPLIPWIDYMYLRMLHELIADGVRVLILSHNDEFHRDSTQQLRPKIIRSKSEGFDSWMANLQILFGSKFPKKLHLGKEYIVRDRKLMTGYIRFIYDDVTSLYASDHLEERTPDHVPNANEFANVIDSFACSSLMSPSAFVLYLGWERQTVKWTEGTLKELSTKLSDGFVVGETIKKEMGHRVDVYSSEHVLNMFDTDEKMARKLFGRIDDSDGVNLFFTDLVTVRNICVGPAKLAKECWDYSTMAANLSQKDLQTKLNNYREVLRPYFDKLTDDLKTFVQQLGCSANELDKDIATQVCVRCTAYSSIRAIRNGDYEHPSEAQLG